MPGPKPPQADYTGRALLGASTRCVVCDQPFSGEAKQYRSTHGFVYTCVEDFACMVRSGKYQRIEDPIVQTEAQQAVIAATGTVPEGWKTCRMCEKPFMLPPGRNSHMAEYCKNPCTGTLYRAARSRAKLPPKPAPLETSEDDAFLIGAAEAVETIDDDEFEL